MKKIAFLKHHDHGNDNYLLSHQATDLSHVNLVVRSLTGHRTPPICTNGQNIDGADQLIYVHSVVTADIDVKLDIECCINNQS